MARYMFECMILMVKYKEERRNKKIEKPDKPTINLKVYTTTRYPKVGNHVGLKLLSKYCIKALLTLENSKFLVPLFLELVKRKKELESILSKSRLQNILHYYLKTY